MKKKQNLQNKTISEEYLVNVDYYKNCLNNKKTRLSFILKSSSIHRKLLIQESMAFIYIAEFH